MNYAMILSICVETRHENKNVMTLDVYQQNVE